MPSHYNENKKELNIKAGGALLGGKPGGSVVSPITTITTKLFSKLSGFSSSLFSSSPKASERPGVKSPVAVSSIKGVGITPVSGKGAEGISNVKIQNTFNPKSYRAKSQSDYVGWRPTSFSSAVTGYSGIIGQGRGGYGSARTGVFGEQFLSTFQRSGTMNINALKPGENVTSTGWDLYAGFDREGGGYGIRKGKSIGGSKQGSLFSSIVKSQTGDTPYTSSSFLGISGDIGSVFHGKKTLRSPSTGAKLHVQNWNKPQFLHNTLKSISDALSAGKSTYTVNTSEGQKQRPTKSHALSADFEIYKNYMNTFFSKSGSGFSSSTPSKSSNLFTSAHQSGTGVSEYSFPKIQASYNKRVSSGEIPSISKWSMDKYGVDILSKPKS